MRERKISPTFKEHILPLLEIMENDGYTVRVKTECSVIAPDGVVPASISVAGACFAYTLHLKELLVEVLPDVHVTVTHDSVGPDWETLSEI